MGRLCWLHFFSNWFMLFVSTGFSCQCVTCLKSQRCVSVSGTRPRCMEIDGTEVKERERARAEHISCIPPSCLFSVSSLPLWALARECLRNIALPPSLSLSLPPPYALPSLPLARSLSKSYSQSKGEILSVTSCSLMWSSHHHLIDVFFFFFFLDDFFS